MRLASVSRSFDALALTRRARRDLGAAALCEEAIRRGEAELAESGPLACRTGSHTGRSARDKFIVCEPATEAEIGWGEVNRPLDEAHFTRLADDLADHLAGRELFVQDSFAGSDPRFRLSVRVITERAWHSLFARNLLIPAGQAHGASPELTVISAPGFQADPVRHGTRSETFIVVHLSRGLVLIGGTSYAGEIKKSVFTVLNYLLPARGVLPMHCSANVGGSGHVALFFGLSGTGKTTLSSDPRRQLIGDDEHGWSDSGVFNFEGGCYAKLIRLSADAEPQIYTATQRFGTVLENVVLDPATRRPDFDDASLTENTRGAYPLAFVENHAREGRGGHPTHIVMLTADAFGVMPPIARLSPAQAIYHFLSGYTARVAGTERGVTEPVATFSTCFAAPFLPRRPAVYAQQLSQCLAAQCPRVWLVNTGWTGGAYGVGRRMPLAHTRAIVDAVLSGALDAVPARRDPTFGLDVPTSCPGVPEEALDPRGTWASASGYDRQAARLAAMFRENFESYAADVSEEVRAAGPVAFS